MTTSKWPPRQAGQWPTLLWICTISSRIFSLRRPLNTSIFVRTACQRICLRTAIVSRAMWHVAPSCWNQKFSMPSSSNCGCRNSGIIVRYPSSLTITAWQLQKRRVQWFVRSILRTKQLNNCFLIKLHVLLNKRGFSVPQKLLVNTTRKTKICFFPHYQILSNWILLPLCFKTISAYCKRLWIFCLDTYAKFRSDNYNCMSSLWKLLVLPENQPWQVQYFRLKYQNEDFQYALHHLLCHFEKSVC